MQKKVLVSLCIIVINILLAQTLCFSDAGDLDPTFGDAGLVTTDFLGSNREYGHDVISIQSDGKIVVVGTVDNLSGNSEFAVARFLVNLPS